MKIPDFETFYNQLVENDIWFDTMSVQHGGAARIREAATIVYGEYVGNPKMFPQIEEARKHIHYKLGKMPRKVETNYQIEKPTEDYNRNPLSEEQKKQVDEWLEEYKEQISQIEAKRIPKLRPGEAETEGQWEKPKAYKHPSTPESLVRQKYLHDEWIRQNFDPYTGKPKPNFMEEEEWLKQLEG